MTNLRAEFEKWHYEHRLASWNLTTISDKPDPMPDGWGLHDKESMWQAYQAGHSAAVPEGWQAVPIEPTREMKRAGYENCADTQQVAGEIYQAMLAAAPTQPRANHASKNQKTFTRCNQA